jgi:hypothetical protein
VSYHFRADHRRRVNTELAMEHARDLRAQELHTRLVRTARRIRTLFNMDAQRPRRKRAISATSVALALAAGTLTAGKPSLALSQESKVIQDNGVPADETSAASGHHAILHGAMAPADSSMDAADRSLIAGYGLDIATIESALGLDVLWRVVRELVLPGRVSEETQRRVLRRVWALDADVAKTSGFASQNN